MNSFVNKTQDPSKYRWLTNLSVRGAFNQGVSMENRQLISGWKRQGLVVIVGPPEPSFKYTTARLESMGMMGYYLEL